MPGVRGRSGGRNAKTIEQLKVEGTYDPSRHAGIENPEPPRGVPTPPKELQGDARAEWDRMIRRLELSRTLSVVDDAALYQYCQLFAATEAIAVAQETTGSSIDLIQDTLGALERGEILAAIQEISKLRQLEARYTTQIRQGRMALRTYLVEFGLTPAARSRVKVTGGQKNQNEQPKSPFAALQAKARQLRAVK